MRKRISVRIRKFFDRFRVRITTGIAISLLLHVLLLTLRLGYPGFGLPGLTLPFSDKQQPALPIKATIALQSGSPAPAPPPPPAANPAQPKPLEAQSSEKPPTDLPNARVKRAPNKTAQKASHNAKALESTPALARQQRKQGSLPQEDQSSPAPASTQQHVVIATGEHPDSFKVPPPAPDDFLRSVPKVDSTPMPPQPTPAPAPPAIALQTPKQTIEQAQEPTPAVEKPADTQSYERPDEAKAKETAPPDETKDVTMAPGEKKDGEEVSEQDKERKKVEQEVAQRAADEETRKREEARKVEELTKQEEIKQAEFAAQQAASAAAAKREAELKQQQEQQEVQRVAQEAAARAAAEEEVRKEADAAAKLTAEKQAEIARQEAQRKQEVEKQAAEKQAAEKQAELAHQEDARKKAEEQLREDQRKAAEAVAQKKAEEEKQKALAAEQQRQVEQAAAREKAAAAERQRQEEAAAQRAQELAQQKADAAAQREAARAAAAAVAAAAARAGQQNGSGTASANPGNAANGNGNGNGNGQGNGKGKGAQPSGGNTGSLISNALNQARGLDTTLPPPAGESDRTAKNEPDQSFFAPYNDVQLDAYISGWRIKIEGNGDFNYSQLKAEQVREDPVVTVWINSDGSVKHIYINRSSGRREIDEAIYRIVNVRAPYSVFPPALAKKYDSIPIRRVWNFGETLRLIEEVR